MNCTENFDLGKCLFYLKCTNIYQAIYFCHDDCLKKYLKLKPDLNESKDEVECGFDKYTLPVSFLGIAKPLTLAFMSRNYEGMKLLLENGADPNYILSHNTNNTLLHKACLCLRSEFVKLLLDYGINIYSVNNYGETCLDIIKNLKTELINEPNENIISKTEDLIEADKIIIILEAYILNEDIKEPSEE